MTQFIMIVGLPASGKSTLAKEISEDINAIILSSDQMRFELYGDVSVQAHNGEVFEELKKRLKQSLKNGDSVVYDSCNISHKRRKSLLDELKSIDCKKECCVMATPYLDCLRQNKLRDRFVPEYVVKKMYLSFFVPQYYEGWDEIYFEWNYNRADFFVDELSKKLNISQNNCHHTLTVLNHCIKCVDNVEEQSSNVELQMAALFHDIGKPFTKQFKNFKGEETEDAHYYNHMNVSAYNSLFYLNSRDYLDCSILNICNYIQWHMQPFFMNTEKAKTKFIKLVGQQFYDNLMILHEADVTAK